MNKDNKLSENISGRAKSVLSKIVDSYLNYGQPVSSKEVSSKLNDMLSPSTIRIVMSNLEASGLLYAPHTSAGRVPTDKGLKLFVDGLLEIGDLTAQEQKEIETRCSVAGKTLLEVLDHSSKQLAGLSNCTSLVFAPTSIETPLKHIEFVALDNSKALVITIDVNGLVENKLINVPDGLTNSVLIEASNYINSRLYGKTLTETKRILDNEVKEKNSEVKRLSEQLVTAGVAIRSKTNGEEHFLINRRDFIYGKAEEKNEVLKLDQLLQELQYKKNFINIVKLTSQGTGVNVFIGSNTKIFNLSGCSMIVAPLKQKTKEQFNITLGAIGVIGPSRLNYSRIIPMVDFTAKVLNKFLN